MSTPEPILKGRFNLWETPDGGYYIGYVADGETEQRNLEIPAMVIRMARLASEGRLNPAKALREMMSNEPAATR